MKSSTFGLGFSRCKLIQTNLTATEDKVIMNLIRSVWIGGYSTKFYTGRYRPKVQPLTLLNTIFDKAEQICASIVHHFLLKAWNLAGSPSVILILILIVLSAKGISHHGGCAIVQVLVLRYNQSANASSETQGQIVGARESLNGWKNVARRKVQNGAKSSSRRSLLFLVPYIFFRPFRLSLAPFIGPLVSEDECECQVNKE